MASPIRIPKASVAKIKRYYRLIGSIYNDNSPEEDLVLEPEMFSVLTPEQWELLRRMIAYDIESKSDREIFYNNLLKLYRVVSSVMDFNNFDYEVLRNINAGGLCRVVDEIGYTMERAIRDPRRITFDYEKKVAEWTEHLFSPTGDTVLTPTQVALYLYISWNLYDPYFKIFNFKEIKPIADYMGLGSSVGGRRKTRKQRK